MAFTPTSYYDYDSTPFMQGLNTNPLSFDKSNGSIYNLNSFKQQSQIPRMPGEYTPNKDLFSDNSRQASAMEYKPTQSSVMPKTFNLQDAHEAIESSRPALVPGDGSVLDATSNQTIDDVKSNLTTIANAKDPDAVAASIMSQPGYGSGSFAGGLMNMGLAIMSGANAQQAGTAGIEGAKYFEGEDRKSRMSEYLRQNTKDLLAQGYSPNSISAAIASGDNSLMKMQQLSPAEKRAQDLQDQQTEFQNRLTLQTNSINAQADRDDKRAETERLAQNAKEAAAEKKAQAQADQKQKTLNARYFMVDDQPVMTNTEFNGLKSSFQRVHNPLGVKTSAFDQANTNLQDARDAKASGDDIASTSAYRQSLEQYVKGIMGSGNRSLDDKQLESLGVDPSWLRNKTGALTLAAGYSPTDDNIKYIQSAIDTDSRASNKEANRLVKDEIDRLVKTRNMDIPTATKVANSYASVTLGSHTYDPYGVFGEPTKDNSNNVQASNGVLATGKNKQKSQDGASLLDSALGE
ncbi:hypothetical protein [Enterobacter hormaechei]|uniref:hypothetical protein n=1 Tax=Enterobacter hormaechei TaxID=158836 RepID=UPI0013D4C92E|nr:hypothetical protein [Enterobacter hormaechei]